MTVHTNPGGWQPRSLLNSAGELWYFVDPSAFGGSIRNAERGRSEIKLLVDHDPRQELASTSDDSLFVWADEEALRFAVVTTTRRGREAAGVLARRTDLRQASIGGHYLRSWTAPVTRGQPEFVINTFSLEDISVCRRGMHPGTWVRCRHRPPARS